VLLPAEAQVAALPADVRVLREGLQNRLQPAWRQEPARLAFHFKFRRVFAADAAWLKHLQPLQHREGGLYVTLFNSRLHAISGLRGQPFQPDVSDARLHTYSPSIGGHRRSRLIRLLVRRSTVSVDCSWRFIPMPGLQPETALPMAPFYQFSPAWGAGMLLASRSRLRFASSL
jgi:hypothetical protein